MTQKSTGKAHLGFPAAILASGAAAWGMAATPPAHGAAADCFIELAQTRNYTLGLPQHATPTPDGRAVLYLRSGARDTRLHLYEYTLETHTERELAKPDAAPETLSVAEKARRERARMTMTGITDYALSRDGSRLLVTEAERLTAVSLPSGEAHPVPGTGWIAPRLSPDGRAVAAVRDNDLHIVDLATGADTPLTHGGTDTLTHGLAEFAAAEELDRPDGTWWSPDGARLVFEESDTTGVERHFIADPEHPASRPVEFRYPRAGTANAATRLGIVARAGGQVTWVAWDHAIFPYIARVIWPTHGPLTVVLLNRPQTGEAVLAVDPATGRTTRLLTETDAAWLDLSPEGAGARVPASDQYALPHWLDDGSGFLWAGERGGIWQLELRHADGSLDHAITPPGFPFAALADVDAAASSVTIAATPDRLGRNIFRVKLAGGAPVPLAGVPGLHDAVFGEGEHAIFADRFSADDGTAGTAILRANGAVAAMLPSAAEQPQHIPDAQYLTVGSQGMDAMVLRPGGGGGGGGGARRPVVLWVYAGPTFKMVQRAPRDYLEQQCLADQGFVVVSLDGRGTPGRDRDWERATRANFIDLPLADQVAGLQAVAAQVPEIDLARAGVTGWSFGGYFTAMATIRRPDIFKAGVAGAPVVDFADYDTAYTERYLGVPAEQPEAYRVSNVLTYADKLSRPLLIMHGLTDDNVYFQNTVKLTQALIAAGKPYQLLLLPGTHQLPDPLLRARVDQARAAFLKERLGG